MIKFIDKDGNIFEGQAPYIHWLPEGQSIGLWYELKMLVITDNLDENEPLICDGLTDDSIFRFVNIEDLIESEDKNINDTGILSTNCIIDGEIFPLDDQTSYRIFQIYLLCKSSTISQITDTFHISIGDETIEVIVGGDFYGVNEILEVNLSNKGFDIPVYVEKAFYDNDYHEANIDSIYINQKFKELLSNYIDIIDCKGSYKSLQNSLEWFDWGDNIKMYEIWKGNDDLYFEKNMESILSNEFKYLLTTQSKTTYISIVAALQQASDNQLTKEKIPVVNDIVRKWSNEDLAIKVSILAAFFEKYFMPIHMDLKRASVEALIYSIPIKVRLGTLNFNDQHFYDINPINIDIPEKVILGNLSGVTVDDYTVFGKKYELPNSNDDEKYYYDPVGVSLLKDIKWSDDSTTTEYTSADAEKLANIYGQLIGAVGVVVPVKVSLDLPVGDGINMEVINLYKDGSKKPIQAIDRKLFMSNKDGKVEFEFKLVSTKVEQVSFSITLHSLSGHTWTATAGYDAIDISGSDLGIFKVTNIDWAGQGKEFLDLMNGNPWGSQYNVIKVEEYTSQEIIPEKYTTKMIKQYLPMYQNDLNQYNKYIIVNNPFQITHGNYKYNSNWLNPYSGTEEFWSIPWGACGEGNNRTFKYTLLIFKTPGNTGETIDNVINNIITAVKNTYTDLFFIEIGGERKSIPAASDPQLKKGLINRRDYVFIPQLHNYKNIDSSAKVGDNGKYELSDFTINKEDLICIIPQFKLTATYPDNESSINITKWEFKNMTTLQTIQYDVPISTPIVANDKYKFLDKGYWTVTMYFKMNESGVEHKITKNSAFRIE